MIEFILGYPVRQSLTYPLDNLWKSTVTFALQMSAKLWAYHKSLDRHGSELRWVYRHAKSARNFDMRGEPAPLPTPKYLVQPTLGWFLGRSPLHERNLGALLP